MPLKKEGELSAFERKRLENIAANKAILNEISTTAKKLIPDKKPALKSSASKRKSRGEPVKRETARPTRFSSRLAGLGAENDELKIKLAADIERDAAASKPKRLRLHEDLNLGDVVVPGQKWRSGLEGIQGIVRGAQPGLRTFDESDGKETSEDVKDLRQSMSRLKLYEHWYPNDIKICPQRIYSLGFHPSVEKPIVFAGDKEGALGVFDGSQTCPEVFDDDEATDRPEPVISAFKTHARTITSFVFSPIDENAIYSSSYDSTIRRLDLAKGVSTQVFAPADDSDEMPLSAMDMAASEPNVLYFSTLDGGLGRYDVRSPASLEVYLLSEQKIGGFSLHPLHPHLVATASLDRTLKIWDLRKILGKGDLRHPALVGEHESRLSVSHAAWSSDGHVATSSYDDTIKIYDLSDAGSWKPGRDLGHDMEPAHTVSHNNQTGRWVTILKPQWQKQPADNVQKFVIGNMNRFLDVFLADGSQVAQLGGEGITAVPAVAQFHPSRQWVAGGTGSGKLCLWC
ncbi:hypothetical protein XA68_13345 [Ophiocordyceps unilateralis]|uniref:DNA damage-binding protein CMR1 n=1 Tax=Ophiocordyceps unilateralis TaxID=268505 RepID=A0A2A9PCU2_OPHUN|nr:hypothetical protein XA68_13345 [Ophiocordyceps unilateralis]